jgi:hypothetical protein
MVIATIFSLSVRALYWPLSFQYFLQLTIVGTLLSLAVLRSIEYRKMIHLHVYGCGIYNCHSCVCSVVAGLEHEETQ